MELAGIAGIGADYKRLTYRELEGIALAKDKADWSKTAFLAHFSSVLLSKPIPINELNPYTRQDAKKRNSCTAEEYAKANGLKYEPPKKE